jgi:hypothetical protein
MIDKKYIAVAIVVVIIVLWFYLRSERMTPKLGGKGKKQAKSSKSGKSKTARSAASSKSAPAKSAPAKSSWAPAQQQDEDEDEDTSGDLNGAELYQLVHSGMCRGMTEDEFRAAAPQYAQAMVYVELLQKHTLNSAVTVRDYEDVVNMELNE